MITRVRQSENSQYDVKREDGSWPFDCSHQRVLPCSVGNPGAGQREAGQSQQNDQKAKQRNEPGDTSAQRQ
jgi:hypothetical protein